MGWAGIGTILAFLAVPFVSLVAANPGYPFPYGRLLIYYVALGAPLTASVWFVTRRSSDSGQRFVAFLSLAIYGLTGLAADISRSASFTTWAVHPVAWIAIGLIIAAYLVSRWSSVQRFVPVLGFILLAWPLAYVLVDTAAAAQQTEDQALDNAWELTPKTTPNIYFFVLDGYAREDVLSEKYSYELQDAFLNDLARRGFSVAENAIAPYPMSYLSISSTLSGSYAAEEGSDIRDTSRWFPVMQGKSNTVATLRQWGYSYAHVPADQWDGTSCSGLEDICLGGESAITATDSVLLQETPFGIMFNTMTSARLHAERSDPFRAVTKLLANTPTSPYFAFIHLLNPHPPYFETGPNCAITRQAYDLAAPWGVDEYANAVECLNRRLLPAIDEILRVDPTALIVLQGDHGPNQGVNLFANGDLNDWTSERAWIRFSVLAAMRLPDGCLLPPEVNTVNTFRIIFNCLAMEEVDLLPSRMWLANNSPGEITEVPISYARPTSRDDP